VACFDICMDGAWGKSRVGKAMVESVVGRPSFVERIRYFCVDGPGEGCGDGSCFRTSDWEWCPSKSELYAGCCVFGAMMVWLSAIVVWLSALTAGRGALSKHLLDCWWC